MSAPSSREPVPHASALLVVAVDDAAPELGDPRELLANAARGERTDATLRPGDAAAVVRRALDTSGPAPHLSCGRHATLEWSERGWRLVAFGAIDPTHGLSGDEGIGPPDAEPTRP